MAGDVVVTVYPIAGKQLFFRVPDSLCRECELTVHVVKQLMGDLKAESRLVRLEVKPWLNNLIGALWRGGWHPPVVTINGRLFSQGMVPDAGRLREALLRALDTRISEAALQHRPER